MENREALAAFSYLITEEDYVHFQQAAAAPRRETAYATRALGFLAVLCGALLFALRSPSLLEKLAWGLLTALGVCLAFSCDLLLPYFVRRRARAFYNTHRRMIVSQSMIFYKDGCAVQTDRYEAQLPYSLFYQCIEDQNGFVFFAGPGEMRYLPKRVMAAGQEACIARLLKEQMGERYTQRI